MSTRTIELRERIRALPGMARLLLALDGLAPAFLVGGAVRDLLCGASSVDLDVAVEGDAGALARAVADRLGGRVVEHGRFGTAALRADELAVDLAATRRERYPRPGALPIVEPAPLQEDLGRRDFTINAIAAGLSGDDLGRLHDPCAGVADVDAGIVRVLHERSFIDDPTRLLRALRYEARLGFTMAPETETLARDAVAAGALATVLGARLRDELLDLLAERNAPAAVRRLQEVGLDGALHPALVVDAELVERVALAAGETGANVSLAALAALLCTATEDVTAWVDRIQLTRYDRERTVRAAMSAEGLAAALGADLSASELHALLSPEPAEALALALALGAPPGPLLRYVHELRNVRLEITGDDLIAAGMAESPAIGQTLAETLRLKLDAVVSGRDAELELALELAQARGEGVP